MPGNGSSGEIDVILIARFGNAAASASVCCCAAAEPIDSAASGSLSEVPILGCHGVMFMWQRHRRHALGSELSAKRVEVLKEALPRPTPRRSRQRKKSL
jgi:hypothetical protein